MSNPKIIIRSGNFDARDEFMQPFDTIFDRVFSDAFPGMSHQLGTNFFQKGSYPKVNVIAFVDNITMEVAVPGLAREEVSVELENNILTISGGKKETPAHNGVILRRELKHSSFMRSFELAETLDQEKIKVDYSNGMLTLTIPKKQPDPEISKVKKIF